MEMKVCSRCKRELTTDKFSKHKSTNDGLNCYCKECKSKISKIFRDSNKEKINEGKRKYYGNNTQKVKDCNKHYIKTHIDKVREDRKIYRKANLENISEYQIEYRKNNVESIKKFQKEYRGNNKEKITIALKKWREENLERVKENLKRYYEKNKEAILKYQSKYERENLEKYRIRSQKRRALKRTLPCTLTIVQWKSIKLHFNNTCAYCGRELPLAQEHFIALSKGGEYSHNNIICACKHCNSSKHNADFFEWYPKYKYYSKTRNRIILKFLNYKDGVQQLSIL